MSLCTHLSDFLFIRGGLLHGHKHAEVCSARIEKGDVIIDQSTSILDMLAHVQYNCWHIPVGDGAWKSSSITKMMMVRIVKSCNFSE